MATNMEERDEDDPSRDDLYEPASDPHKSWTLDCHPISTFASVELAAQAINATARENGYGVVTLRSKENAAKEKVLVVCACDRHEKPKPYKPKTGTKRRKRRATRKCNCPMRIYLTTISSGIWTIEYRGVATSHNHEGSFGPSSHPTYRRDDLTPAILKEIEMDYKIGVRPGHPLGRLVASNTNLSLTIEDIYNAGRKIEKELLQGKSRVQYRLDQLSSNEY